MMVGSIINVMVNVPDIKLNPIPRYSAKKIYPNKPNMMEGIPARVSVPKCRTRIRKFCLEYSVRNTAASTPMGTAMISVNTIIKIVLRIMVEIPPTVPPSLGSSRMKMQAQIAPHLPLLDIDGELGRGVVRLLIIRKGDRSRRLIEQRQQFLLIPGGDIGHYGALLHNLLAELIPDGGIPPSTRSR